MTISNDIVLLIISGVGVILWWFVVTLIKELKDQNSLNMKMLIGVEKDVLGIRLELNNHAEQTKDLRDRLKNLEENQREKILAHNH